MSDFILHFDTTAFEQLDEFALLAHQDYNLANQGDWFGLFGVVSMDSMLACMV